MKNSKLVRLLSTLDKKEVKGFEKYLSGLYNKHKTAIDLFQHLKKYHPKFEHRWIKKEHIARKVLNDVTIKRVSNEASQLYEWLEEFLIWEKLNSPEYTIMRKQMLAEVYSEKGNWKQEESILKETNDYLLAHSKGQREYHQLNILNQRYYYNQYQYHYKSNSEYLLSAETNLKIYYYLTLLQYTCELLFRNNILGEKVSIPVFEIEESLKEIPLIQLHLFTVSAVESQSLKDYEDAYKLLFDSLNEIAEEDAKRCFNYLVNIVAQLMRNDPTGYTPVLFELYKEGNKNKLLISKNRIAAIRFHNIISLANALKEFEWGHLFIKQNASFLEKGEREDIVALSKATLFLGEERHDAAIKILIQKKSYNSIGNNLKSRAIYLCCLLGDETDIGVIDREIGAFNQYLNRNQKLEKTMIEGMKNMLSIIKYLHNGQVSKNFLIQQLQDMTPIYMKSWLLSMTKSYRGNN